MSSTFDDLVQLYDLEEYSPDRLVKSGELTSVSEVDKSVFTLRRYADQYKRARDIYRYASGFSLADRSLSQALLNDSLQDLKNSLSKALAAIEREDQ